MGDVAKFRDPLALPEETNIVDLEAKLEALAKLAAEVKADARQQKLQINFLQQNMKRSERTAQELYTAIQQLQQENQPRARSKVKPA